MVHDTTVTDRVEYLPDTIAVYFKEIKITTWNRFVLKRPNMPDSLISKGEDEIEEICTKGYVIWQSYTSVISGISSWSLMPATTLSYYHNEFKPTEFINGKFLYADKKTPVTNHVLYTILR